MSSDADVLFGKIAIQLGLLTKEQIDAAVAIQELEDRPRPLGEILVEKRYITQDELEKILQQQKANLSQVDDVTKEKKEDILFGKVAIREGLATVDEVNECLREQAKMESDGSVRRLGELMLERGILSSSQVQRILEKQKRRIMVCRGCKARYNVPTIEEGKPIKCPRCGGDVVLPTEVLSVQVEGAFDGSKTQDLVVNKPQAPATPARVVPQAPATPPRVVPQAPVARTPSAPATPPAPPQTPVAPAARPAVMTRRPTVVMQSPFPLPGTHGASHAAPAAPKAPTPAQGQPAVGGPTKTPASGVPALPPTKTPTAVPPPKGAAATRTPTSVQRIMPAPGATSGIMRAVGGGGGPKKGPATCPICDHNFTGEVDPATGRVKCPQCKTSFTPH